MTIHEYRLWSHELNKPRWKEAFMTWTPAHRTFVLDLYNRMVSSYRSLVLLSAEVSNNGTEDEHMSELLSLDTEQSTLGQQLMDLGICVNPQVPGRTAYLLAIGQ